MTGNNNHPLLILQATRWAQAQQEIILQQGQPLNEFGVGLASKVGVAHPERIRILYVEELPAPVEEPIRSFAINGGLIGPNMIGMALGYGVFAVQSKADTRLFSHEFRHVAQYEKLGGIDEFIPTYMDQIFTYGYARAPLEEDARKHEVS
jgi:hypothetical protein